MWKHANVKPLRRRFSRQMGRAALYLACVAVLLAAQFIVPARAMAHDSVGIERGAAGTGQEPSQDPIFLPVVAGGSANTTEYQASIDRTDSLLVRATRADGKRVDYFGSRTAAGIPETVDHVTIHDAADNSTTSIEFDMGLPNNVTTDDGTRFELFWTSETEVRIKVVTADGKYEASMPVDFSSGTAVVAEDDALAASHEAGQVPCRPAFAGETLSWSDVNGIGLRASAADAAAITGDTAILLNVQKCGQPFDPRSVKIRYEGGPLGYYVDYPAIRQETGVYRAQIPSGDRSTDIADVCNSFAEVMGTMCTVFSTISAGAVAALCAQLAARIPPLAVKIAASCVVALAGLGLYCNTLGQGPEAGPDFAAVICNFIKELEEGPDEISLTPHAIDISTGERVFGTEQVFPQLGPWGDLTLTLTAAVTVEDFMSEPHDPAPDADYVAYVTVYPCLGEGQDGIQVTLTVEGTDGYTDSQSTTISVPTTLRLVVPGAEENVQDVITVDVEGWGSKNIVVVF